MQFDNYENGKIIATKHNKQKYAKVCRLFMGSYFRIAMCNLKYKTVKYTKTHYQNAMSVEGAFANFRIREED
ncbi:MAG TPA: hypothetical protein PLM93_02100 [Sulfuricurvum sp.]|nr:hypothetical protein [Sulfuricurvum sp.]HQT35798.1 hypothetical protein [Sulfuricurvum sp.]